jgi:membrane protease YdiL (CAAX protease family)
LLGGGSGVLAVAVIPGGWAEVGLGLARPLEAALFVGALLVVVLPIIFLQTRQPDFWALYPEVRASHWSRRRFAANGATWAVYLLGYEFLFRGVLLFTLAQWLGPWPAVVITTLAYVWAHLAKFSGETLGSIPVGVLFAVAALYTGGLWAPFVAHVIIANFSDVCVTWHNPRIGRA